MSGLGSWVHPNHERRWEHYLSSPGHKDEREASYMRARAEIEDAIPAAVFEEMIKQGYDPFSFVKGLEDLCSLIKVVQDFMTGVFEVSVGVGPSELI